MSRDIVGNRSCTPSRQASPHAAFGGGRIKLASSSLCIIFAEAWPLLAGFFSTSRNGASSNRQGLRVKARPTNVVTTCAGVLCRNNRGIKKQWPSTADHRRVCRSSSWHAFSALYLYLSPIIRSGFNALQRRVLCYYVFGDGGEDARREVTSMCAASGTSTCMYCARAERAALGIIARHKSIKYEP